MKKVLKDEKGYPIGVDISKFYSQPEEYYLLPEWLYNTAPYVYKITTWGRIINTELCTIIPRKLIKDENKYVRVAIKNIYGEELHLAMHQIVTCAFHGVRPIGLNEGEFMPNHKDGVKWHNEPYNLEWVTIKGNAQHANENDLIERAFGEDNGYSALTDAQYEQICQLTQDGYLPYQINKIMNVGIDITNIAQKIRAGKSETIISEKYDFSNIPRNDYRKFTEEQVRYICTCLQDHPEMKPIDIIISMGYDVDALGFKGVKKLRDTISTIKRRVSYIEIGKDYDF